MQQVTQHHDHATLLSDVGTSCIRGWSNRCNMLQEWFLSLHLTAVPLTYLGLKLKPSTVIPVSISVIIMVNYELCNKMFSVLQWENNTPYPCGSYLSTQTVNYMFIRQMVEKKTLQNTNNVIWYNLQKKKPGLSALPPARYFTYPSNHSATSFSHSDWSC